MSQCLEKKLYLFGFEIPDLLLIFIVFAVLNFLFGQTHSKVFLVWLPALLLAATLRYGKRGKPDGYLIHLVQFHTRPKSYSAFEEPTDWVSPPSRAQTSLRSGPS